MYSWRLPIFNHIQWENSETMATLDKNWALTSSLCYMQEMLEERWESIRGMSSSRTWYIGSRIPFTHSEVDRLLNGLWLNDEIINAYLHMCSYLQPDIKFLSTFWLTSLEQWGPMAAEKSTLWVSVVSIDMLLQCWLKTNQDFKGCS